MQEITKENILKFIKLKKEYEAKKEKTGIKDTKKLKKINDFIDNVINKDKRYYHKITSYDIPKEDLKYLL